MPPSGALYYDAPFVEPRSRLTTFFRFFLAIPHFVVLCVWGIGVFFAVVVAWFALLFTGRYPGALYEFVSAFARYAARVSAYLYLASDPFPPFGGGPNTTYVVDLHVGPPQETYSRLWVLLRFLPLIVVYVIAYFLSIASSAIAFLSWFVIVVLGRQVGALHGILAFCLSYQARAMAYALLLTETFPGFESPSSEGAPGAVPADASGG